MIDVSLAAEALAALARLLGNQPGVAPEADVLRRAIDQREPMSEPLRRLAEELELARVEQLTIALLIEVERDPLVGRALARLQAPLGGSRPTVALVLRAFGDSGPAALGALVNGAARDAGVFEILHDEAPLVERPLAMHAHVAMALLGEDAPVPGESRVAELDAPLALAPAARAVAERHAAVLANEPRGVLTIRASSQVERRAAARAVAEILGRRALFLGGDATNGLAPTLLLRGRLPVFSWDLGPGERKIVPSIVGYRGPTVVLAGPDGVIDSGGRGSLRWTLPVPSAAERKGLWEQALGCDDALAKELAAHHRHGASRIAELARRAQHHAGLAGHARPTRADVVAAMRQGDEGGLSGLAELLPDDIPDEALVLAKPLAREMRDLLARCRARERLVDGLGVSARTRYRAGVRALFVGPSGTGKTLAAGWLATQLGLPLYRVDLAAVTSKYIGETEKNLAQMLAHAEHAEVLLLFDEADSMFAKRTDVRDANDRFANAQTNYLLQRIESFDGITILTSNSRARFDDAFTRRLDVVVEFPQPGPEERRALWRSHLGDTLDGRATSRLAALLDLAGGHVRNAVLNAAALARADGRGLTLADVVAGVEAECKKLGRPVPPELRSVRPGDAS